MSGYVLKDAPIDQLVDTVRRVHAGERVVDPALAVAAWDGADPMTARERDVLRLAADGLPNTDIAAELHLTEGTVRNSLSTAISKLGTRNRIEAARVARDRGWLGTVRTAVPQTVAAGPRRRREGRRRGCVPHQWDGVRAPARRA